MGGIRTGDFWLALNSTDYHLEGANGRELKETEAKKIVLTFMDYAAKRLGFSYLGPFFWYENKLRIRLDYGDLNKDVIKRAFEVILLGDHLLNDPDFIRQYYDYLEEVAELEREKEKMIKRLTDEQGSLEKRLIEGIIV